MSYREDRSSTYSKSWPWKNKTQQPCCISLWTHKTLLTNMYNTSNKIFWLLFDFLTLYLPLCINLWRSMFFSFSLTCKKPQVLSLSNVKVLTLMYGLSSSHFFCYNLYLLTWNSFVISFFRTFLEGGIIK